MVPAYLARLDSGDSDPQTLIALRGPGACESSVNSHGIRRTTRAQKE